MQPEQYYCALVEYDGTDFLGYQVQVKGRTVQGEIEKALRKVTQTTLRINGAGRTDTGVHATGQIVSFKVGWRHQLSDLHRALNATLPSDIIFKKLKIVSDHRFHPRFSALKRSYCYTIVNEEWPSVLARRYAHHVPKSLDIRMMQQASKLFIGSQDFAAFGKPTQGESTTREIMIAEWDEIDNRLVFHITANAFLYRMVRKIVGTLIDVGLGRLTLEDLQEILLSRELTRSSPPAPACGLCLVRVDYSRDLWGNA